MKLSANTITVLKNFSTLNPAMIFKTGNELRITTPLKTVIAVVKVEDTFETSFSIGDLPKFLSVLSLFEAPDLTFGEAQVVVKAGKKKLNYTYSSESVIVSPPWKELKISSVEAEFELRNEVLGDIIKGASVLGLKEIAFVGNGTNVSVQAVQSNDPSSSNYSIEVGESENVFRAIYKVENMKLLPCDYKVKLSKHGMSEFTADNVQYIVALEASSKFN